jgi:hypothetical protein
VGALAAEAGFRDSYREAYPDPVAKPGFTWTPGGPEDVKNEVHDRIDWVLAAGPAEAVSSEILGEAAFADTDIAADPFPSDHRGVVSTFSASPASAPTLISLGERRVFMGERLEVRTNVSTGEAGEVGITAAGGTEVSTPSATIADAQGDATREVSVRTDTITPGAYDAVLLSADGEILDRSPFWVYPPEAPAVVAVADSTLSLGDSLVVMFSNAPGNRWDWIGIYKATDADVPTDGSIPDDSGDYLGYDYTRTEIEGEVTFPRTSYTGSGDWPLSPGRYEVRLMIDDGYETLARSEPFTVGG